MKQLKYFIGVTLLCLIACVSFTFAQEVDTIALPERIRVYSNQDFPSSEETCHLPEHLRVYSDEAATVLPYKNTYLEQKEVERVIDKTDDIRLTIGAYLAKDRSSSKIYASHSKVLYVDLSPSKNHNFTDIQVTTSSLDSGRTFSVKVRGLLHHPGPGKQKEVIIEYFDFR